MTGFCPFCGRDEPNCCVWTQWNSLETPSIYIPPYQAALRELAPQPSSQHEGIKPVQKPVRKRVERPFVDHITDEECRREHRGYIKPRPPIASATASKEDAQYARELSDRIASRSHLVNSSPEMADIMRLIPFSELSLESWIR